MLKNIKIIIFERTLGRKYQSFNKTRCVCETQMPLATTKSIWGPNTAHVMSIHCCFIFTIATRLSYHVVELNFDKRFWHNMGFFTLENKQWNTSSMSNWSHDLKHRGCSFLYARLQTGRIMGMVMTVRVSIRVSVRPSIRPSVRPTLRPSGLRRAIFRIFLLHALTYWAEILHMTLFWCTTDQVRLSTLCVNFWRSYASLWT